MLTGVEEFRMSDSSCVDPVALDKTLKHIYIKSNSLLNKIITVRAVRPDGPPSVCGNQKTKKNGFLVVTNVRLWMMVFHTELHIFLLVLLTNKLFHTHQTSEGESCLV